MEIFFSAFSATPTNFTFWFPSCIFLSQNLFHFTFLFVTKQVEGKMSGVLKSVKNFCIERHQVLYKYLHLIKERSEVIEMLYLKICKRGDKKGKIWSVQYWFDSNMSIYFCNALMKFPCLSLIFSKRKKTILRFFKKEYF